MGDFLLDLRPQRLRAGAQSAELLRFIPTLHPVLMDFEDFSLALTYAGDETLWAPYRKSDGSLFAVAGMTAFADNQWEKASTLPDPGGLASKALCQLYTVGGLEAIEQVSGNCVLIVFDAPKRLLHVVTDCAGAFPVFESQTPDGWVFGSHTDVIAGAVGEQDQLDEVSLAEFVIGSTVTPPFTYYRRIRAVDHGTSITFDLATGKIQRRQHFDFHFQGDPSHTENFLAEQLAGALKKAVQLRTHPRFGTPVIALSGGMDSRLLLACLDDPTRALTFTCYDEPNRELARSKEIAESVGAKFLPLQRGSEYYAENAASGIRISGGMGTFANNHFLGVLERLHAEGMQVLLTGCYCDYLFKGLPLNRYTHWLTGNETLAILEPVLFQSPDASVTACEAGA